MHLRAVAFADLISCGARAVAIRKRYAFRIGGANGQVVFAQTTSANRTLNAVVAVVPAIAARRTTIRHLVDVAARRAFLTSETIGQVEVGVDAIGELLSALVRTHRHICGTRIDAIHEVHAIDAQRARLQFVKANAIESALLTGRAISSGITSARSRTCTLETRNAGRTNGTAHAAVRFVRLQVDAFRTALGQTSAARVAARAIRANFARGTSHSTHPAVARIELRVDADAIAFRRAARALRIAHAIRANLTHRTCNAARAAVSSIDFGIDARIGAFRRATSAIERALAARANFARSANRAAHAAVQPVIADIDA